MLFIHQKVFYASSDFPIATLESHRIMSGADISVWNQAIESLRLDAMHYTPLKYS